MNKHTITLENQYTGETVAIEYDSPYAEGLHARFDVIHDKYDGWDIVRISNKTETEIIITQDKTYRQTAQTGRGLFR